MVHALLKHYAVQEFNIDSSDRLTDCIHLSHLDRHCGGPVWNCFRDLWRGLRDYRCCFRCCFWSHRWYLRMAIQLGLAIWWTLSLEHFYDSLCGGRRSAGHKVAEGLDQLTGCLLYKSLFKKYLEYIGYFFTSLSSGLVLFTNTTLYWNS